MRWLLLVCLGRVLGARDSEDCARRQPHASFSAQQLAWLCSREEAMRAAAPQPLNLTASQWGFLRSLSGPSRRKRQSLRPDVVRREYRMLSDEERERVHAAMNRLKRDTVDGKSKWDILTEIHNPANARNAHWGPGFLPWHREFLHRFEEALRAYDATVAVPYWDSTLDAGLPSPHHSVLWTPAFLGNGDGFVVNGPFAHWQTHQPLGERLDVDRLYRTVGNDSRGRLYTDDDIRWLLTRTHYSDLSFCEDKTFERTHGLQHLYVGGFLEPLRLSANDPAFYLIHSFVDFLWELFRTQRQTPAQRENQWLRPGHQVCKPSHGVAEPMVPFQGMRNGDGLSARYTERYYRFEPRPVCQPTRDGYTCGSPYLFCDTRVLKCRGKIRVGGDCKGFEGTEICQSGFCHGGQCVHTAPTIDAPSAALRLRPRRPLPPPAPPPPATTTELPLVRCDPGYFKVLLWGSDGPVRSSAYSVTLSGLNHQSSDAASPLSFGEFPEHEGLAYVRFCRPAPDLPLSVISIQAKDSDSGSLHSCTGNLSIARRPANSDPVAYTHDLQARRALEADLSGHPEDWSVAAPYLNFLCDGLSDPAPLLRFVAELKPRFRDYSTVWLPTVVLDRREPFRRPVTDAQADLSDLDQPHFSDSVRVHHRSGAPYHSGAVYLRARNPFFYPTEPVRLRLGVSRLDGRPCRPVCSAEDGTSSLCSGELSLSLRKRDSFQLPFTTDWALREFLGWRLQGHPHRWSHRLSPIRFYCYR